MTITHTPLANAAAMFLALASLLIAPSTVAQTPPSYNCTEIEEHRQFDFWLGRWKVTDKVGDTVYGHNEISMAEKGCVLIERWQSANGGSGTSMNYYNPVTGEWHQDWVDSGATVINTRGALKKGAMAMRGKVYYMQSGQRADFRGTWTPQDDGRVRQFFEQKDDKGEWQTWFDGYYAKEPVDTESKR